MTELNPHSIGLVARLGDALGNASRPLMLETELSRAVANVRSLFGAAACSCARVDTDGEALTFVAADGSGAAAIVGVSLPISRGIAGWVAMSGQPIAVADVSADTRFARDIAEETAYIPTTILAAPLVDRSGEVAGVIEVLDPQTRGDHSGQDLAVLGVIATQLASIVRMSDLYDALGTGLIRSLVDPEGVGSFDDALTSMVDPDQGVALNEVAVAFRDLAGKGPSAARLARQILRSVGSFVEGRG